MADPAAGPARRRRRWTALLPALALAVCLAPTTRAQYDEEDDQTRDHTEQDRAYYERYADPGDEAKANDEADPKASLEAFLSRAEQLIRDRSYSAGDSPHYRVQTDDPRLRPDVAARLLESFRGFFDGFWPADVSLAPYDETSRVFLFYSYFKFNELLEGEFRSSFRPKGHYGSTFDVVTIHTDAGDVGSLADVIVHEAAHQLFTRRVLDGEPSPSLWLNEGIASYFGFTRADEGGGFAAGEIGGKSAALFVRPEKDRATERKLGVERTRDALRQARGDERSLVDELVSIDDPAVYYGEQAALHYAASWLLVHFLFHGDEGEHAAAFRRWLVLERERRGGREAFYRELGVTPQQLEEGFAAHIKRLKVR
jgi:hypothetical protein